MDDIDRIIQSYKNVLQLRPLKDTDPSPIRIRLRHTGPIPYDNNRLICDHCGTIVHRFNIKAHKQDANACRKFTSRHKTK